MDVPADAGPTWSDIAAWYDQLVRHGSGPHDTAVACLLGLIPDLAGATVLDVACGQGLATRAVAGAGAAQVVGTDASEAMVALARRHPDPPGSDVSYVVDDAQGLTTFPSGTFDGVTCQLGLMDIPDLDAALGAAHRVLRPGGWFVFVIGHPCVLVPDALPAPRPDGRAAVSITGYFDERFWRSSNPNGVRRAGNHHRTLATYLNGLVRAGLVVDAVDEPLPAPRLVEQQPLYAEVPIFFAARATRRD
ncbi:MAG: methyltransferase domain-containing protein [Acidimicrobiales bacterium]|nr:methyltransferase domain-containing protein [Acidimicrobiales bacterium]